MESVVNKIIEIDRMADSRIVEAEESSKKLIADTEIKCSDLKSELAAAADKRIMEIERINRTEFNAGVAGLEEKYSAEKKDMDSFFENRHIEIENTIFAEIVGE